MITLKEFWNKKNYDADSYPIQYKYSDKFSGGNFSDGKYLWYNNGGTSIPLDDIQTYEELEKRCDEYLNDNLVCIRCKKAIKRENDREYERYWAGVYCNSCWTNKDQFDREWNYKHLD